MSESSFPKEIRKQVKYLSFYAKKASLILGGLYRSSFHGEGMIFSEFREYIYGDDVRHISWSMTAKWDKTIVKLFEQERQTPVVLALDVSGSLNYGTTNYSKKEVSIHLAALLGMCAEQNRDPVGLLLFSDQIEKFTPPRDRRGGVLRLLFESLSFKTKSTKTSLRVSCEFLLKSLSKRSIVFLISDFFDEDFDISLRALATKHQVIALKVEDPSEKKMKGSFLVRYKDLETNEEVLVDSASSFFKNDFSKLTELSNKKQENIIKNSNVSLVRVETGTDYVKALIHFFKRYKA